MASVLVFGTVCLAATALILTLGIRGAALLTPVVLGVALYVVPGPTAAFLPASGAWTAAMLLLLGPRTLPRGALSIRQPIGAFLLLLGTMGLVLLWSPEKAQGLRIIIQGALAIGAGLVTALALRTLPANALLAAFVAVGSIVAIAVAVFRFVPALEHTYLQSPIATLLIERSALRPVLLGSWEKGNNIVDPVKSGAIFLNANVASVYLSVVLAAATALVLKLPRSTWPKVAALVLITGVVATGSRTGLAALVTFPIVFALTIQRALPSLRVWIAAAAVVIVVWLGILVSPDLAARISITTIAADERFLLWPLAAEHSLHHPFIGGGFGDWETWLGSRITAMGVDRVLPPHNILLHLALWGGLTLLMVFGYFVWTVIRESLRVVRTSPARAPYGAAALAIVYVVFLHAMLDNFFLFEWRVGPTVSALLVCTLSSRADFDESLPQ